MDIEEENYKIFYNNLEAFGNELEGEYWDVSKILKSLAYCWEWEVKDKRFFNKKKKSDFKPYKCICGVCIKDPYPFHIIGRENKKLFVGSKCIERVCKHNKYEVAQEFQNAVFNTCRYKGCNKLIIRRDVVNKIVMNYCSKHRQGYGKYLCSGCNAWSTYNEGRPTQSYCEICVDKAKRDSDKYKCKCCKKILKTDKWKYCYDCKLINYIKCPSCGKQFDSECKYEKCFKCHFAAA